MSVIRLIGFSFLCMAEKRLFRRISVYHNAARLSRKDAFFRDRARAAPRPSPGYTGGRCRDLSLSSSFPTQTGRMRSLRAYGRFIYLFTFRTGRVMLRIRSVPSTAAPAKSAAAAMASTVTVQRRFSISASEASGVPGAASGAGDGVGGALGEGDGAGVVSGAAIRP